MKPLVVIGDVMLDVDVETTADRLSPDGAAPVLDERARQERAGGAALAARLAARIYPGQVVLVAPMPDDRAAARVAAALDPGVELVALPAAGSTPMKTRLRCGGTTVARLDEGGGGVTVRQVSPEARRLLDDAAAVLVSDYGGGATHCESLRSLLAAAAARVPVVWDPHPRGAEPVPGVTLVTPNAQEARQVAGHRADGPVVTARRQAEALVARWHPRGVAVTLGHRGAMLYDDGGRCTVFPPPDEVSGDACGAGDCFAAAAVVALAGGALPSEAVARGVASATYFLAQGGVAALQQASADASVERPQHDAERLAAAVRARGGTVVATGGCFDLLHAGHVEMLAAARRLGDCLIVCLNSDDSVRRLKGDGRPLQNAHDRAHVLRALRAVDAVLVFDEDMPVEALRRLRPHVWVKGDDYAGVDLPEASVLETWDGCVVTVPYLAGRSTTGLVELSRR